MFRSETVFIDFCNLTLELMQRLKPEWCEKDYKLHVSLLCISWCVEASPNFNVILKKRSEIRSVVISPDNQICNKDNLVGWRCYPSHVTSQIKCLFKSIFPVMRNTESPGQLLMQVNVAMQFQNRFFKLTTAKASLSSILMSASNRTRNLSIERGL